MNRKTLVQFAQLSEQIAPLTSLEKVVNYNRRVIC